MSIAAWRRLRRHKEASPGNTKLCDGATSPAATNEGPTLFDALVELQTAGPQQRRSTKSNLVRDLLRGRRQSVVSGQSTTAAKPSPREISRDLARSFLLRDEE
jgi:hypothetical protein